MASIKANFQK